jgi:thymidine kinase
MSEEMFIEPRYFPHHRKGWIEVVCGSMFSGKTEELIRRVNRARIAGQKVEIFKPSVDKRYHDVEVTSHNENKIISTPVDSPLNILLMVNNATVVAIDEAQFFDDGMIYVAENLASKGIRVIIAGLDMDYTGMPFGAMPKLMAVAEYVTKVHAICVSCGDLATHSFRKVSNQALIMLGETESYEARCRYCFNKGMGEQI